MARRSPHSRDLWRLADEQYGRIARWQLLELGLTRDAILHRCRNGRLHPIRRGVYAVGRRDDTRFGRWMTAVLACGAEAVLSQESAAVLWGLRTRELRGIEVSVPRHLDPRPRGILVHRRTGLRPDDLTQRHAIPVTSPVCTIVDLAARLRIDDVERMVNDADNRDLIDPETLRAKLEGMSGWNGVKPLRTLLDRRTFVITDTMLEQRFVPIARRAGLPKPLTQERVNGFRVDFYWPGLGLVVEADSLRYHRTASAQTTDRVRDQRHTAAGLTSLRFTRAQVWFEPGYVEETLVQVASRLHGGSAS